MIWYVDSKAEAGGDGTSWNKAFSAIEAAVQNPSMANEDEFWIKRGKYFLKDRIRISIMYAKFYGGFSGVETLAEQRDPVNNITIIDGGDAVQGFYCEVSGPLAIDGLTIRHCSGGALTKFGPGSMTVSNCTFKENRSDTNGAAIFTGDVHLTVSDCHFLRNVSSADGGAIFHGSGNHAEISGSLFKNNHADGSGGAVQASQFTVTGCEFVGNSAGQDGGAVCGNIGSSNAINSLFLKNSSLNNGGAICGGMFQVVTNCTFVKNRAGVEGGAVCNQRQCTITNSILWKDTPTEIFDADSSASVVTYSDVWGGCTGTGNINANPNFAHGNNYHLEFGSPCIDAGTASAPLLPATDFDGNPRIGGSAPDMGYVELDASVCGTA